ncbi:MAG TPA: thiamine diphosphokinase [Fimbriimonas sp.]
MGNKRVLGVLAGEDMPLGALGRWAASAEILLAADGGADRLRAIGLVPDATIGDLDSILPESREIQRETVHDPDQDTSDCDKLLALAQRRGHRGITLASVEGDLLDHMIGTLSSAVASPLEVRFALRRGVGWILKGAAARTVGCRSGSRVSLLPLGTATISMAGVEWPLVDRELSLGGKTSLSNRATQDRIVVRQRQGASLLYVEFPEDDPPLWPDAEEPQ